MQVQRVVAQSHIFLCVTCPTSATLVSLQAGVKGGSGQASPWGPFNQTSCDGFGATSSQPPGPPASGFGSSGFGGGFGQSSSSFGVASTPAFGQASTPAFSFMQTPSAGAGGFGHIPFGSSSIPGFGTAGFQQPASNISSSNSRSPASWVGDSTIGSSNASSFGQPSCSYPVALSSPPSNAQAVYQNSEDEVNTRASGFRPSQPASTPALGTKPSQPASPPASGNMPSQTASTPASGTRPCQPASNPASGIWPSPPARPPASGARPAQPVGAPASGRSPSQPAGGPACGVRPAQPANAPASGPSPSQPAGGPAFGARTMLGKRSLYGASPSAGNAWAKQCPKQQAPIAHMFVQTLPHAVPRLSSLEAAESYMRTRKEFMAEELRQTPDTF